MRGQTTGDCLCRRTFPDQEDPGARADPPQPMRQWVLSFPFLLRFLFASKPAVMGKVLGIVYRTIATHLAHKGGFAKPMAQTGAVTLI